MDWKILDAHDQDLGGSNPLPLNIPRPGGDEALILALGTDRKAYLLDRNNLGGIGGQLSSGSFATFPVVVAHDKTGGLFLG